MMTNSKILGLVIVIASILVASPFALQNANAGLGTVCSTDKNNPTTGTHGLVFIVNTGDDCYIGEKGISTTVNLISLDGGGKVVVVNTTAEEVLIENTSEKIKFKDNFITDDQVLIRNNNVSHLEIMDNDGTGISIIITSNQANILKVVGNSVDIPMKDNTIDSFAICKNNTPEPHSWAENTYNGKNKGCP